MNRVFSALFWIYLGLTCVLLWPIAALIWLVCLPFDPRRVVLHRFSCWWGFHYVQLCPVWQVQFEGLENIPTDRPAMLVANHQSLGDIPVLYGLKRHFKWVSKAAIFKLPIIGWNMRMNRYVRLVRGNRRSVAQMLDDCKAHLLQGSSILMFPEGTRSKDGQLRPFKPGSFLLARKLGVPVVPIVLDGTVNALPKDGWVMKMNQRRPIRISVLPPVEPAAFGEDAGELAEQIRTQMARRLSEMRTGEAESV